MVGRLKHLRCQALSVKILGSGNWKLGASTLYQERRQPSKTEQHGSHRQDIEQNTGFTLTGVKSRSSSASVADVAASIKSSQRFPWTQAAVGGSADIALRPSMLNLRENSFDFVRSCFAFRAFWPTDDFRGLCSFPLRCIGGNDEYRPGGECASIEGNSSLGRFT